MLRVSPFCADKPGVPADGQLYADQKDLGQRIKRNILSKGNESNCVSRQLVVTPVTYGQISSATSTSDCYEHSNGYLVLTNGSQRPHLVSTL